MKAWLLQHWDEAVLVLFEVVVAVMILGLLVVYLIELLRGV